MGFFKSTKKILVGTINNNNNSDGSFNYFYSGISNSPIYLYDFLNILDRKLLTFQALIFFSFLLVFPLIFIELPFRISRLSEKNKYKQFNSPTCLNLEISYFNFVYGSCPNNTYIKLPRDDSPEMSKVIIYTDHLGGRKSQKEKENFINLDKKKLFIIGDSFIQADEVEYEETFYGLINKKFNGKPAYGFGYSSWNTTQYLKSVKLFLKENKTYHIYLFENDFAPNESTSTYQRSKKKKIKSKGLNSKISNFLLNKLYFATSKKINEVKNNFIWDKSSKDREVFWNSYDKLFQGCEIVDLSKNANFSKKMQDRIIFSSKSHCWPDLNNIAYDYAVKDLLQIKKIVLEKNSKVKFFLMPSGFNFINNNSKGRLHPDYGVPNSKKIVYEGLINKLKIDLGNNFVDIYPKIFEELKRNDCEFEECLDLFYFRSDGHLTQLGHNAIYKINYENFSF